MPRRRRLLVRSDAIPQDPILVLRRGLATRPWRRACLSWHQRSRLLLLALRIGYSVWLRCSHRILVLSQKWIGERVRHFHFRLCKNPVPDADVVEQLDSQEATLPVTQAILGYWIHSLPFHGSSSDSLASHGNGYRHASTASPQTSVLAEGTETYPWTKTRRSCASRMKSRRWRAASMHYPLHQSIIGSSHAYDIPIVSSRRTVGFQFTTAMYVCLPHLL